MLLGQLDQRTICRDLIVLGFLPGKDQTDIPLRCIVFRLFVDDLLAFFHDALQSRTFFRFRFLFQ